MIPELSDQLKSIWNSWKQNVSMFEEKIKNFKELLEMHVLHILYLGDQKNCKRIYVGPLHVWEHRYCTEPISISEFITFCKDSGENRMQPTFSSQ